ncbi:MAG: signal peptidase I [Lachnospiraceae bacterium]|nr:signal peptidase I [Lachnospiraceae bacterium]MBP3507011.1 signal peptidase I [Lachnospiraceae bacterium]
MRRKSGRRAYLRANRNRLRHTREKKEINKRELIRSLGRFAISILIVMIIGYSIVEFGVQTLRIVGQSMEPTLQNGDVVLVNKIGYVFGEPQRFDIIAFKQREGDNSYYNVKRVIGLPGETVTIQDGYIFIDGVVLTELPFEEKIATEGLAMEGITLEKGEYFVLGDNVNNSEDSRFANMGNILENEILGKVVYRWLPKTTRGKL